MNNEAKEKLRKLDPYFDQVEAALDQFYAGKPVTEYCLVNGERLVVERSQRLGRIRVQAAISCFARSNLSRDQTVRGHSGFHLRTFLLRMQPERRCLTCEVVVKRRIRWDRFVSSRQNGLSNIART